MGWGEMQKINSLEDVIFKVPLYEKIGLPEDMKLKGILFGTLGAKVDGYCPYCKNSTTFRFNVSRPTGLKQTEDLETYVKDKEGFVQRFMTCARQDKHLVSYFFLFEEQCMVTKVGQHPSVADLTINEAANYRQVLEESDATELHKAIGLAAHGVGIGSFVYLSRTFERLIFKRFFELQKEMGWNEDDFKRMQMDEKVAFLDGHVPKFLVENRKLYSLLSTSIHELDEQRCLDAFSPIFSSLKFVLEEEKRRKKKRLYKKKPGTPLKISIWTPRARNRELGNFFPVWANVAWG